MGSIDEIWANLAMSGKLGHLDAAGDEIRYPLGVAGLLLGIRIKPIPIAKLLPEQANAIGVRTTDVLLSSYTAIKLDLKPKTGSIRIGANLLLFDRLPEILLFGECRKLNDKQLVFLWSPRGEVHKPYKAIVKATRDGRLFLDSAYRIQPSQIARVLETSSSVRSRMLRRSRKISTSLQ